YLKQAISKYTAFDSTPSPPPIPSHSRPGKAGSKVAHRLPIKPAVPATPVAIPLSNPALVLKDKNKTEESSQTQQVSWATVARNGQKKFRLSIPTNSEVPQVSNTREQYHEKDIQGQATPT
ncbi:putative eka-like protein, partial [Golovinomyces cichoracearum]